MIFTPFITIDSEKLENISGISKKSGQKFSFDKQSAYFFSADGQRFPEKFSFIVGDSGAYQPGDYHLDLAKSLRVDRNGQLSLGSLSLTRIENALKKSA